MYAQCAEFPILLAKNNAAKFADHRTQHINHAKILCDKTVLCSSTAMDFLSEK